jgi:hypothetical protein
MFCSPLCVNNSEPYYKVIDLNNDHDIVLESKKLVNLFLEQNIMKVNDWKYIRVTEDVHINCLGNPTTIGVIPYEDTQIDFKRLVDISYTILEDNEFYVIKPRDFDNERDILIEIHYANAETKPVYSKFDIHQDNDAYVNGDVHKLLVYIDVNCEGGDLDIYDNYGKNIIQKIPTKIEFNKTRCVLLNGKCYHTPTPILSGNRIMISYQFRRNRK